MVLSKHIIDVIEQEYPIIIGDIPLLDILYNLRSKGIISDEEVDILKVRDLNNKARIYEFLKILKTRRDDDFYEFCSLLKESPVRHISEIGQKLEIQVKNSKKNGFLGTTQLVLNEETIGNSI
ncbi:uncharacterized protein TRIADDRAFT_61942 [Trichoplax adhaerens]|uniref:CARD domain-containing protein n=1 Tax=Trichoplax adhaerens TaxID=10228 RepID=B3SCE3_TRIAD|nr:predicted protein [Trichoplax adhaerens]EDV19576.1 predicted protein [Trichoplax adhaerens]|eukprot:XP_002117909.1 predicted protein [Trichoplax adhaerens]